MDTTTKGATTMIGKTITIRRLTEGLELTRPSFQNLRLSPGDRVTVVADNGRGRLRVRTASFGYETWISRSNVERVA
jgi:hypothetical protein